MSSQPFYSCAPIKSLRALSLALQLEENFVQEVAGKAGELYRLAKPIKKSDGTFRQPFDALEPLKNIHRRIKDRIFAKTIFPYYLTGSLRGRDYRTNAELHAGAKLVICEDITRFFPSTSSDTIYDIWRHLFEFSDDVAQLLTALTTKEEKLPEGAITSSYLANLAFWRFEPLLHDRYKAQGIQYSRYVDDITVSSRHFLSKAMQTEIIGSVYGLLRRQGYSAKRRKHEMSSSGKRMMTTKLMLNRRPAMTSKDRANTRTAVFQLEKHAAEGIGHQELSAELRRVAGRVSTLTRFHPTEGHALMGRVKAIRQHLNATSDTAQN